MAEIVLQEQLLECAICMERLDENCKMLPCQHTYCKMCLIKTFEHEGSLSCPQCRKVVSNTTGGNFIDDLPTNLMLLNLIELVKNNPPKPRNEEDELQAAIMNSIEDFQKENAIDVLLKHNEQLQTQLAMESSKRDNLLKNTQDLNEEYNELFLSQRSFDEVIFTREKRNLLSETEKHEVEVAVLKSEEQNSDYIADLISWFERNYAEFTQDSKKEAQSLMKSLRGTKVVQLNDSIQRRIRTLLENLTTPDTKMESVKDVAASAPSNDDIVNEVDKKLEEVKKLLRDEINFKKFNAKLEKNFLSQSRPSQCSQNIQNSDSSYDQQPVHQHTLHHYYTPPSVMSISPRTTLFKPNVYHQQPFYGPTHNFPTSSAYPLTRPFGPISSLYPENSQQNHGNSSKHDSSGNKQSKGGHHLESSTKKWVHPKFADRNYGQNLSRCLILPDVRDYACIEKKMNKLSLNNDGHPLRKFDKNIRENVYKLPASSKGKVGEPLLMLPDVRHYEKIYSKFPRRCINGSEDEKNDAESFGIGRNTEKIKDPKDVNSQKHTKRKPQCLRGKNWYRSDSKSTASLDGFESDSSINSMTSSSSKMSTCSTPTVFCQKNRVSSHRRKNRDFYNRNFQRKSRYDGPPKEIPNENKTDALKKLIYPSKEEALAQNLDVNNPFKTPLVCLGKNGDEAPVPSKVECLADIYAFEEKYSNCQLIDF